MVSYRKNSEIYSQKFISVLNGIIKIIRFNKKYCENPFLHLLQLKNLKFLMQLLNHRMRLNVNVALVKIFEKYI